MNVEQPDSKKPDYRPAVKFRKTNKESKIHLKDYSPKAITTTTRAQSSTKRRMRMTQGVMVNLKKTRKQGQNFEIPEVLHSPSTRKRALDVEYPSKSIQL